MKWCNGLTGRKGGPLLFSVYWLSPSLAFFAIHPSPPLKFDSTAFTNTTLLRCIMFWFPFLHAMNVGEVLLLVVAVWHYNNNKNKPLYSILLHISFHMFILCYTLQILTHLMLIMNLWDRHSHLFYRWVTQGTVRLNNLPKVTYSINGRGRLPPQNTQRLCS